MEPKSTWAMADEGPGITMDTVTDGDGIKLTGSHEIKYGAYSAAALSSSSTSNPSIKNANAAHTASAHHDTYFSSICEYLLQFLGNNLYDRRVMIVSSGWYKGYNFFLSRGGSTISHHNLLIPSPHHAFDNDMDHIQTMRRMKYSLPPNCEANLSYTPEESMDDRIFIKTNPNKNEDKAQSTTSDVPSYKFISCSSIFNSKIITPKIVIAKKLSITNGPKIRYLSEHQVMFYAEFKGTGVVRCSLYEMPTLANYNDAVSLVLAERDKLQAHTHAYIYIYAHTYTHTHTHAYTFTYNHLHILIITFYT